MFTKKNFLLQRNLFIYVLIIFSSYLGAFRSTFFLGYDFGLYYVLGQNNENLRLYDQIPAMQGPTFYFFLKLINVLIPFSVVGAQITLFIIYIFWFISILILTRPIENRPYFFYIVLLSLFALTFYQNSNVVITLLSSSFLNFGLFCIRKFFENAQNNYLILALNFFMFAGLARVNYFLFFLVLLVFLFFRSRDLRNLVRVVSGVLVIQIFLVYLFSLLLNFKIWNYISSNTFYIFGNYLGWLDQTGRRGMKPLFSLIAHNYLLIFLLFLLSLILISNIKIIMLNFFDRPILSLSIFLLLAGIIQILFTSTGKMHHIFSLAPLYIFIFTQIQELKISHYIFQLRAVVISIFTVCFFLSSITTFNLQAGYRNDYVEYMRMNRYISSVSYSQQAFFSDDGWPFVFIRKKPTGNFFLYSTLAIGDKSNQKKIVKLLLNSSNKYVWINKSLFNQLELKKESYLFDSIENRMIVSRFQISGDEILLLAPLNN